MKLKYYIALILIASNLIMIGGCKKETFNINSNPDAITDASVTPGFLLPGALQNTARIVATDWSFLNAWMGYWSRSGSFQSLTEIETYQFTNDFQVQIWNDLYSNNTNYTLMANKAKTTGAGFYEAIGRIMRVHNFGILVDVYGNVPYFDAFKGTAIPTPRYDKGADIYKDLFIELDSSIALLKNASAIEPAKNPDLESADLAFGGNATSWIRFANTLRLRLVMHLHNGLASTQVVVGFDIPAQMAKITADGFIGAGQTMQINPGFSGTKPNPYYRAYVANEANAQTGEVWRAGAYAVDYYKYNGDLRASRFYLAPGLTVFGPTNTLAAQKGIKFGTPSGDPNNAGDKLSTVRGPGLIPQGAASRAWIFTSVESLFLQAEARQRNVFTTGTATVLLTAAVRESFVFLGLTSANADAYLSNNAGFPDVDISAPPYIPGQPGGGLYTIFSQKWFALNASATYEIWTDYRRTDYVLGRPVDYDAGPPISVAPSNTSNRIPRRLLFPQNEYNYNASNVSAEGKVDVFANKIFWDLN